MIKIFFMLVFYFRFYLSFLFLFSLFLFPAFSFAQEAEPYTILKYDSDIEIRSNGVVHVEKTVTYNFTEPTSSIKHDIYHDSFYALQHVQAYDQDGTVLSSDSFSVKQNKERTRILLNFQERSGQMTWTFSYSVYGAIDYGKEHDKLDFSVAGHGTPVTIQEADTRISFPEPFPFADQLTFKSFVATVGTKGSESFDPLSSYNENTGILAFSESSIFAREHQKVLIELPKNYLERTGLLSLSFNSRYVSVTVDGIKLFNPLSSSALALPIGKHTVVVDSIGYEKPAPLVVDISANQKKDLAINLEKTLWLHILFVVQILFAALLPFIVFIVQFRRWRKGGKDHAMKETVIVQYSPPHDLSLFHAGYLYHNEDKEEHITAGIIELARQGYLIISEYEQGKYKFTRTEKVVAEEHSVESLFLRKLLRDNQEITTEHLKHYFFIDVEVIRRRIRRDLVRDGFYERNPDAVRSGFFITLFGVIFIFNGLVASLFVMLTGLYIVPFGILLCLNSFIAFLYFMIPFYKHGSKQVWHIFGFIFSIVLVFAVELFIVGIGVLLTLIILLIFSRLLVRRSKKGMDAYWHLLGLRNYLETVESSRMENIEPDEFTELMPYAIALGVTDQWSSRLDSIPDYAPAWYVEDSSSGSSDDRTFYTSLSASILDVSLDEKSSKSSEEEDVEKK